MQLLQLLELDISFIALDTAATLEQLPKLSEENISFFFSFSIKKLTFRVFIAEMKPWLNVKDIGTT